MSTFDYEEITRLFKKRTKNVQELVNTLKRTTSQTVSVETYELHPLQYASSQGNEGLLSILLNCRIDIDKTDNFGNTPLMIGVKMKQENSVRFFTANKADLNIKDCDGWTPVHVAVKFGYWSIGKRLISSGANLDIKNSKGDFPLFTAVTNGNYFTICFSYPITTLFIYRS